MLRFKKASRALQQKLMRDNAVFRKKEAQIQRTQMKQLKQFYNEQKKDMLKRGQAFEYQKWYKSLSQKQKDAQLERHERQKVKQEMRKKIKEENRLQQLSAPEALQPKNNPSGPVNNNPTQMNQGIEQHIETLRVEKQKLRALEREKIDKKLALLKQKLDQRIDYFYRQAVALYDLKKYIQAKKKFEVVEDLMANYKKTRAYLGQINKLTQ